MRTIPPSLLSPSSSRWERRLSLSWCYALLWFPTGPRIRRNVIPLLSRAAWNLRACWGISALKREEPLFPRIKFSRSFSFAWEHLHPLATWHGDARMRKSGHSRALSLSQPCNAAKVSRELRSSFAVYYPASARDSCGSGAGSDEGAVLSNYRTYLYARP